MNMKNMRVMNIKSTNWIGNYIILDMNYEGEYLKQKKKKKNNK